MASYFGFNWFFGRWQYWMMCWKISLLSGRIWGCQPVRLNLTKVVDSFFRAVDMLKRMDGAYSIKHEMTGGVAVKVVWGDEDG